MSHIFCEQKTLGCGNEIFGSGEIMLVLILLMHKVEALLIDCRVHCGLQGLPILKGRIRKWILTLLEFDLTYQSAKAIKGQVMTDLVTQHCGPKITVVEFVPWTQNFLHCLNQIKLFSIISKQNNVISTISRTNKLILYIF
jgi:hypothetical protein